MKKKSVGLIISVYFLVAVFYYIHLPEYMIYSSTSFSSGGSRDTELNVITYHYWGITELVNNIKEEHITVNGKPTSLEIRLYRSKYYLHKGKPFKTIVFNWTN